MRAGAPAVRFGNVRHLQEALPIVIQVEHVAGRLQQFTNEFIYDWHSLICRCFRLSLVSCFCAS